VLNDSVEGYRTAFFSFQYIKLCNAAGLVFIRIVSITFRQGSVVADALLELENVTNVIETKQDIEGTFSTINFQGLNVTDVQVESE